jgi:hypothetical protein
MFVRRPPSETANQLVRTAHDTSSLEEYKNREKPLDNPARRLRPIINDEGDVIRKYETVRQDRKKRTLRK